MIRVTCYSRFCSIVWGIVCFVRYDLRCVCVFFQAEDGIRDLVRSRGLGDVYKRQALNCRKTLAAGKS